MVGLIIILVLNLLVIGFVYYKEFKATKKLLEIEQSLNNQISFNLTQQKQIDTLLTAVMNIKAKL